MSVTGKKEATTAISDNSLSSLVLGRSGWIIEDDNFGIKQLQANFHELLDFISIRLLKWKTLQHHIEVDWL